MRSHDNAVEKAGFGDVGDPAVNNDAGIEDLIAFLALLFAAEDPAQRRQIQQVALIGAHDESDVGHQEHYQDLEETLRVSGGDTVANYQCEQIGAEDAKDAADGAPIRRVRLTNRNAIRTGR